MMILIVYWCGSSVPPLHMGLSSILLYLPFWSNGPSSWSSYVCLHPYLHLLVVSLDFFCGPHIGCKNCVTLLSALSCFFTLLSTHLLTLHPQFISFTSQITARYVGSHSKIKIKTQEVMTQYLQIYYGYHS